MTRGSLKFFELVKEMRELQIEYFATRSETVKWKAMAKEKEVDKMIKAGVYYLEHMPEQLEMKFE